MKVSAEVHLSLVTGVIEGTERPGKIMDIYKEGLYMLANSWEGFDQYYICM